MTARFVLLLAALLPGAALPASAQSPPSPPAAAAPSQLDRIEGKLDELLRRLPPHPPEPSPSTTSVGQASGSSPSPAPGSPNTGRAASPATAEYRPGALAVVRPAPAANAVLAIPADTVGGFVFTGGTLRLDDLSSHHVRYGGLAGVELQGWLRAREAGRYQLAVDFGSPRAGSMLGILTCGMALWLEGRQIGQRTGELSLSAGSAPVLSLVLGAELQPGLYRLRLWAACGRPFGPVPLTADLLLKTPSELNLRGLSANDVVHRQE
jgi:hypothetical protein